VLDQTSLPIFHCPSDPSGKLNPVLKDEWDPGWFGLIGKSNYPGAIYFFGVNNGKKMAQVVDGPQHGPHRRANGFPGAPFPSVGAVWLDL